MTPEHRRGQFKVARADQGHKQPSRPRRIQSGEVRTTGGLDKVDERSFQPRHHMLSGVDKVIAEEQQHAKDWNGRDHVTRLVRIAGVLSEKLPIHVKDGVPMKVPLFGVAEMNRKCFGQYKPGRNDLGIAETVVINEVRLSERRMDDKGFTVPVMKDADVALHLVMLLVLCWRHQTGGSGSATLDGIARKKLESFGLKLGKRSIVDIAPDGKFAEVLSSGGMGQPPEISPLAMGEGRSSNRLWSCRCQRVRVGRGKFVAHCPLCEFDFEPGDHVGKYPERTSVTDTKLAAKPQD